MKFTTFHNFYHEENSVACREVLSFIQNVFKL